MKNNNILKVSEKYFLAKLWKLQQRFFSKNHAFFWFFLEKNAVAASIF
jgi:hypothetical protein